MNAYVFLAAIFATPAFGLHGRSRRPARGLHGRSAHSCSVRVFPILGYTNTNLWVSTVMIGIAFSLVPAVLWPAVPYIVTPNRLGTGYGLMTMLQNIGMMLANLAAGALNDASGAGAGQSGRLSPDVVDVLPAQPLRLRVRRGASHP